MPISKLNIEAFLEISNAVPILDTRSPLEYEHAHIPSAISFPIFDNEERKQIGTTYKQISKEQAIKIGLEYFGSKMLRLVEKLDTYFAEHKMTQKEVRVHCWRGGMRSSAMAWLLDLYGYKVNLLLGGYKSYRHFVIAQFEKSYRLGVVGGYTGSNKTGLLQELKSRGEKVIDLEALAGHKGSAYGNLDAIQQPTQEQFENLLALELERESVDSKKTIWLEAESQRIGLINIPASFFASMRKAPLFFLDIPFEQRLQHIVDGYGKYDKDKLVGATLRIKKKLGGLETKNAVNALLEDNLSECFSILLHYYDKLYLKSTNGKDEEAREIDYISSETTSAKVNAGKLLQHEFKR